MSTPFDLCQAENYITLGASEVYRPKVVGVRNYAIVFIKYVPANIKITPCDKWLLLPVVLLLCD